MSDHSHGCGAHGEGDHLCPTAKAILREHATEPPFTGAYWQTTTPGTYVCRGCASKLFSSQTKYDAGCGWPSFWQAEPGAVQESEDRSLVWEVRTEVSCANCGGHLGHVFMDGPPPTGLRYCINSGALTLIEAHDRGDGTK